MHELFLPFDVIHEQILTETFWCGEKSSSSVDACHFVHEVHQGRGVIQHECVYHSAKGRNFFYFFERFSSGVWAYSEHRPFDMQFALQCVSGGLTVGDEDYLAVLSRGRREKFHSKF